MRLPSIKTIAKEFPTLPREGVKKVREILERYCYSPGKCLREIDKIIETCGLEYIESTEDKDNYRKNSGILYCNAGDTYATTFLYDYRKGRYYISCWGDMIEKYPKRFGY